MSHRPSSGRIRLQGTALPAGTVLERAYKAIEAKRHTEAATLIGKVLRQHPNHPPALLLLALIALDAKSPTVQFQGETLHPLDMASQWVDRALAMAGDLPWPAAWNMVAMIRTRQGRFAEAVAAADKAIAQRPELFEAHNNRANALAAAGDYDAALAGYAQAALIRPGDPSTRFNRAFIYLDRGDWAKGFEWFEARWSIREWERDHGRPFHTLSPRWFGGPLHGKRLFLHWEQGYGDTLMMVRYLPWVLDQGPVSVTLEVQATLRTLLAKRLPHDDRLIVMANGDPIPPFDLWCPLMSLPYCHRTTQDTVPPAPYLSRAA